MPKHEFNPILAWDCWAVPLLFTEAMLQSAEIFRKLIRHDGLLAVWGGEKGGAQPLAPLAAVLIWGKATTASDNLFAERLLIDRRGDAFIRWAHERWPLQQVFSCDPSKRYAI